MKTAAKDVLDSSTEERIKEAARRVFLRKGYAATRVRDIAQEADLNMALLHYYFRSKEKLFDLVMLEKLHEFAGQLQHIMLDEATSLREKVERIAAFYIDLLLAQPELPVFIFSELRAHPRKLSEALDAKKVLLQSRFAAQLRAEMHTRQNTLHPLQLLMSLLGMAVFPFIARPVLQAVSGQDDAAFTALMQQRKQLIPQWFELLLQGG